MNIPITMLRNLTILYMEYFGVLVGFEYLGQVLPVGVGDKDLSELVALHHLHDALYAFAVKSIENIVEQQYWFTYIQSLCQFHREDESTLLSLRADLLERIVSKTHFQVIFMDTL